MKVFVLPLGNVVFYPGTSKPLNVVEPHYVQMIQDSLRLNVPVAIGFVDDPSREHYFQYNQNLEFVPPVVGYGVPLILEVRPDGSLLIFLQGRGKARLGKVLNEGSPYIVCEAEKLVELNDVRPDHLGSLMTLHKVLVQWVSGHVTDPYQREVFLKNLRQPEEVVGCFASFLVRDNDMQQMILESDNINEKIDLIHGMVASGEAGALR